MTPFYYVFLFFFFFFSYNFFFLSVLLYKIVISRLNSDQTFCVRWTLQYSDFHFIFYLFLVSSPWNWWMFDLETTTEIWSHTWLLFSPFKPYIVQDCQYYRRELWSEILHLNIGALIFNMMMNRCLSLKHKGTNMSLNLIFFALKLVVWNINREIIFVQSLCVPSSYTLPLCLFFDHYKSLNCRLVPSFVCESVQRTRYCIGGYSSAVHYITWGVLYTNPVFSCRYLAECASRGLPLREPSSIWNRYKDTAFWPHQHGQRMPRTQLWKQNFNVFFFSFLTFLL